MDSFSVDPKVANLIWDRSPIIIALLDNEGKFVYVNHMAQHFWEYTEAELRKKTWQEITHPEDLPADVKMHELLRSGQIPHYTMCKRYLTKSGRISWASLNVHLLNDSNGNFLYYLSQVVPLDMMHHDNTDQLDDVAKANIAMGSESWVRKMIKDNWKWAVTTTIIVVGGLFTFFSDVRVNEIKTADQEKRIEAMDKKIEKNMEAINKKLEKFMEELRKDIKASRFEAPK